MRMFISSDFVEVIYIVSRLRPRRCRPTMSVYFYSGDMFTTASRSAKFDIFDGTYTTTTTTTAATCAVPLKWFNYDVKLASDVSAAPPFRPPSPLRATAEEKRGFAYLVNARLMMEVVLWTLYVCAGIAGERIRPARDVHKLSRLRISAPDSADCMQK